MLSPRSPRSKEVLEQEEEEVERGFAIDVAELKMDKEPFASGAFGTVHRGHYYGATVCIKVLKVNKKNQEDVKQVEREIKYFKTLSHPNLVQFYGMMEKATELYIVTEYVPGGNLRFNMRKDGPVIPWEIKYKVAYQIVSAIAFLHSVNAIHRDIKAENILVGRNWSIKVCDLGFTRKVQEPKKKQYMTLCGTEDFMAPEVTLGMEYDASCDIFSFGLVLLEIITQEHVEHAVPRGPATCFGLDVPGVKALVPADCNPEFLDIALKCCEYEPKDRYDASQLLLALKKFYTPPEHGTLTGGTRAKFLRKLRLRSSPNKLCKSPSSTF
eukprot:Phypoly_transcript_11604.p1 GENE.Phypoly_transcript_11604~~Phypoly_transcript_11604.p1  ORF type:complete len:326 (+),score=46.62 Phypoly_transcript_11604:146-1123(+)